MFVKKAFKPPLLDTHELAAGKLAALCARRTSRDLFDAHHLFKSNLLSIKKLKPVLIAYFSMTDTLIKNFTIETSARRKKLKRRHKLTASITK